MRIVVGLILIAMLSGCTNDPGAPAAVPAGMDETGTHTGTTPPSANGGASDQEEAPIEGDEDLTNANETVAEEPDEAPPLVVDVGGPYSGENLAWIDLEANATGGLGSFDCTWSGEAEFQNASACVTQVRFSTVGSHAITVQVTDGDQAVGVEVGVEVVFPVSDGVVTGSIFAYNEPGSVGISNVVANAAGTYYYAQGSDVSVSGRSVAGPGVSPATTGHFFILDVDGNVVKGPVDVAGSEETLGSGTAFSAGTHTLDMPAGTYYLAMRLLLEDGYHWIQDGSGGHETGHKEIELLGSPA